MDALSSQATAGGYVAAILGADNCPKFLPMLTTAAGTIRPATVLILGAGVAGLMAIATAKRLGAIVEAYDVRRAAGEQVRSLGARFLELEGEGGDLPVAHPGDSLEVVRRVHEPDDDCALGELIDLGDGRGLDAQHDLGAVQQVGPAGRDLRTGGREELVGVVCACPRVVLDPDLVA
jgi:NADPH:quinone reductase-like Zn-dependent oxidoreductase